MVTRPPTACCTAHQKSATNPAPSVRRSTLTPPFTPIFLYAKNFATNYHQTYCCHKHSCKLALFLFQGPASPHRLAFPHPPHSRGLSRGLRNAALWRSLQHLRAAALFEYLRRCTRSCLLKIEQPKNALHFRVRHSLVHHRGLSRALKTPHWGVFARRTGGGPELFSSPDGAPD